MVGVLTEMKMRSASLMAPSMSSEKKRLRPLHLPTTSSRPGSKMGREEEFQRCTGGWLGNYMHGYGTARVE